MSVPAFVLYGVIVLYRPFPGKKRRLPKVQDSSGVARIDLGQDVIRQV